MSKLPNTIYDELLWRGLIHQTTPIEDLQARLDRGPLTLYAGFDPTADSLHVGNLLQIIALKRFQLQGHKPLILVGGATGLVGDPSGKQSERVMNASETVEQWSKKIAKQLEPFLDLSAESGTKIVNNYDWLSKIDLISYLRDIGKHFSVNEMVARDSVKTRLDREGTGISYTEFSYMILQAYDFFQLFQKYDCELQIGGSDQWGNIVAGVDLIRKRLSRDAYAVTLPLITNAEGKKLGKTENGAVWLDAKKTSPFHFYQFWLNADDRDVIKYLKYYTFLSEAEIKALDKEHNSSPEKRTAQEILATELTKLVHGEEGLAEAKEVTHFFFKNGDDKPTLETLDRVFGSMPADTAFTFDTEISFDEVLVKVNLANSKGEANRLIIGGGVYYNHNRLEDGKRLVSKEDLVDGKYLLLQKGKKSYKLCKFNIL